MQRRGSTDGRRLSAAIICAAVVRLCVASASTFAAEPSSVVELRPLSNAVPPAVYGISADGSTTFGTSQEDDEQGSSIGVRPLRWNAAGEAFPLSVPADDADAPSGAPVAASADGSTIVGSADRYESHVYVGTAPKLWAVGSAVGLEDFEADSQGERTAAVRDVSLDGAVLCGTAKRFDPTFVSLGQDAIRWDATGEAIPLHSLGADASARRFSWALTISGDGATIGGLARKFATGSPRGDRPVLWSANGTLTELPTFASSGDAVTSGEATCLSFDGSRAFGRLESYTGTGQSEGRVAVVWKNGSAPVAIGPRTALGDSPPYSDVLVGCSESGTRAVGYANLSSGPRGFVWTAGQGTVDLGTLYPQEFGSSTPNAISADGSTVVGTSANGGVREAFVWRDGQMRSLRAMIQAAGVDLTAEGWQTFDEAIACSSDGSVVVGIGRRNDKVVAYRAKINDAPTLKAPTPVSVECMGGQNLVDLAVTANDANSADRLTVAWKVDGVPLKTLSEVVPGTIVTFRHDYPDGAHAVAIEVTDGAASATSATTVTVVDTTAPTVIVAADLTIATDAGKATASDVTLTLPTVEDLCDGEPHVTNDAPAVFPLGPTIVRWTAKDKHGNVSVGAQRVTVVDREKPRMTGPKNVTVPCDRGQTYATIQLRPATATDNVPQGLKVVSTAKVRYRIGKSTISWTATDAAGNRSTWSAIVTVLNKPPVADAGKNVTITTKSERGARVTLDGSRSSDPDGHDLTYRWSAPGVRISKPTSAKMTTNFPVGSKTVKLTVTDEAGAKKVDSVRVTVKLKNAKRRPRGAAANEAFEETVRQSTESSSSGTLSPSAASGRTYAAAAHRLGIGLGDHVRWDEGQSPDEALLRYAEQRELQRRYGQFAARRFFTSFLEMGDEADFLAAMQSLRGVAHAAEDLAER